MSLKSKLQKVVDKATLKLVDAVNPEIEEDSFLDLKIEQIEGREHVERPVVPIEENKPVYRADGQVHNFAAAPWPGKRRMTINQYNARFGNARPEPKHSVAKLVDVKSSIGADPENLVTTKPQTPTTATYYGPDPYGDDCGDGDCDGPDPYGDDCGDGDCEYCGGEDSDD